MTYTNIYPFTEMAIALKSKTQKWPLVAPAHLKMRDYLSEVLGVQYMAYFAFREGPDMEFIDYRLTEDEKYQAKEFEKQGDQVVSDALGSLLAEGYRITMTWDNKNNCYIVSLMGREETHRNYKKCMTTRHGDLRTAISMCVYKETFIFAGAAWSGSTHGNDWG